MKAARLRVTEAGSAAILPIGRAVRAQADSPGIPRRTGDLAERIVGIARDLAEGVLGGTVRNALDRIHQPAIGVVEVPRAVAGLVGGVGRLNGLHLSATRVVDVRGDGAHAQESNEELAKKLNNPVAGLISVPFQFNYDEGFGPDDGARYTLNIQPVMPVHITPDWNLIIRTILPVIYQERTSPTTGAAQGLGDTTQSFFFSPSSPKNGVTWGIGPAFLWPTGESELGSKKWGAGPTAIVLKQQGGFTYGVLANHIWSYAGADDRGEVNSTFIQPFLTHTWPTATTLGVNTESTYDWANEQWTVPINLFASQVVKFGKLPVQLSGGPRYYAASPDGGPEWGARFVMTFLFPK